MIRVHCVYPRSFIPLLLQHVMCPTLCNNENDDDVWFRFTCPANGVNIYPEEGALITSGGFANLGMEIIDATNGISQSCTANYGVGSTTSFQGRRARLLYQDMDNGHYRKGRIQSLYSTGL